MLLAELAAGSAAHHERVRGRRSCRCRRYSLRALSRICVLFATGILAGAKSPTPRCSPSAGEEMVLLDPDLYFPNRFRFEPTPDKTACC